MTDILQRLFWS